MKSSRCAISGGVIALLLGALLMLPRPGLAQPADRVPPLAPAPPPAPAAPGLSVTTPDTDLMIGATRGKLRLRAPYSSVKVDADGGEVKVRAPHLNLEVRW